MSKRTNEGTIEIHGYRITHVIQIDTEITRTALDLS